MEKSKTTMWVTQEIFDRTPENLREELNYAVRPNTPLNLPDHILQPRDDIRGFDS